MATSGLIHSLNLKRLLNDSLMEGCVKMKSFYVSYGMDVGCRCLQMFVHDDGSSFVDFDVGSF